MAALPLSLGSWSSSEDLPLKDAVDAIRIDLATFRAQFANGRCATGHQAPFEVVLFVSGDDPTGAPHNLTAIQNTTDITLLSPAELTSYLMGYGLSAQGNPVNLNNCTQIWYWNEPHEWHSNTCVDGDDIDRGIHRLCLSSMRLALPFIRPRGGERQKRGATIVLLALLHLR
ncbi:hypothetical protein B0H14DRAFT_3427679 [Mycena olivaceomarginata]|nr:hypothetical protein B0H14DRAFT_3427679 [Mycena olivaceomarginata]